MSIHTEADPKTGVLRVTLTGEFPQLPEMVQVREQLLRDGQITDDTVELVDAREVTGGLPRLEQARTILYNLGTPPRKRALLVKTDVQYGIGRMVESISPETIHVFRNELEAVAWLLQAG